MVQCLGHGADADIYSNHTVPENHPQLIQFVAMALLQATKGSRRGAILQFLHTPSINHADNFTFTTKYGIVHHCAGLPQSCNSNLEQALRRTCSVASSGNGSCLSSSCRLEVSRGRKRSKRRLPYAVRDKWQQNKHSCFAVLVCLTKAY